MKQTLMITMMLLKQNRKAVIFTAIAGFILQTGIFAMNMGNGFMTFEDLIEPELFTMASVFPLAVIYGCILNSYVKLEQGYGLRMMNCSRLKITAGKILLPAMVFAFLYLMEVIFMGILGKVYGNMAGVSNCPENFFYFAVMRNGFLKMLIPLHEPLITALLVSAFTSLSVTAGFFGVSTFRLTKKEKIFLYGGMILMAVSTAGYFALSMGDGEISSLLQYVMLFFIMEMGIGRVTGRWNKSCFTEDNHNEEV